VSWKTFIVGLLVASFSLGAGAYLRLNVIDTRRIDEQRKLDIRVRGADAEEIERGEDEESAELNEPKLNITGRINILLLGEDNVDQTKRSDTVAFIAVDVEDRNVRVLSLPRDTRVSIPRHGQQKLNHAYAFGKVELLRETVERFLDTHIHYYVKIDYDNFPKLVDLLGGVDITVEKPMKYRDRKQNLNIDIPAGRQRMNGATALKYVRFRKDALGDIGRVQRQQQFLKALLRRIYEPENLLRFSELANGISNTLVTDIEPSMVLQICNFLRKLDKESNRFFFLMLPGQATLIDGLSYWVSDQADVSPFLTANVEQLQEMTAQAKATSRNRPVINGPSSVEFPSESDGDTVLSDTVMAGAPSTSDVMSIVRGIPNAVAVLNGTGKAGLGKSVASHLQKMGVDVAHIGNAKHFDYRSSNVIYPEGSAKSVVTTAEMLSKLCGISGTLTRANKQATYPSIIVGHDYEALLKRLENSYVTMR
jgi:LCP family protein required for cell wall assembly